MTINDCSANPVTPNSFIHTKHLYKKSATKTCQCIETHNICPLINWLFNDLQLKKNTQNRSKILKYVNMTDTISHTYTTRSKATR